MPKLKKIVVKDFRNIEFQELSFSPNVNCISGNNGEGKTNLLDAIWYLSMTKSAFTPSDSFNYRHGTGGFTISGTYLMENGLESKVSISSSRDEEKKVRRDDKAYQKVSAHIGLIPIVLVSPSDNALVSEGGEDRRRFMNAVLSQMDGGYLQAMQQYNRLLIQRNNILKNGAQDLSLLEVYDLRMEDSAARISQARMKFAEELSPVVSEFYRSLSGGDEEICIKYRSDLEKGTLSEILASCREKDMALRYTSAGIQRDDLIFTINGYPIRRCGSQGQQKSFLVALKFAQYEIMKKQYGFAPILLLDDLFDKLDMNRVSNLLAMVSGNDFGQIFITDSNKVRMAGLLDSLTEDRKYLEAEGGAFREL